MSEFVSFLPPPGDALSGYNSSQLHNAQGDSKIPEVFADAMSVREEVYVTEQRVPLDNEFDFDDARSYHWVVYASVGTSSVQPEATGARGRDRKGSTANRLAVGTIRLVPPPHAPHPAPGSQHKIDNADGVAPNADAGVKSTEMHDGKEQYAKLGRLAVLAPFRGLGLSDLLVKTALSWAASHRSAIVQPISATVAEQRSLELGSGANNDSEWRGLVLVHSQTGVEKVWTRHGFVRDHSMGAWDEEGIEHVGMWKRIELLPEERKRSV